MMSMSVSHTSASEAPEGVDPVDALWQLRGKMRRGMDVRPELAALDLSSLEGLALDVASSVRDHCRALSSLAAGDLAKASHHSTSAQAGWLEAVWRIEALRPSLTPLANAFHLRLANRHSDDYHALARRTLKEWAVGSKIKSAFTDAVVAAEVGDFKKAAEIATSGATEWRVGIPVRLPGLRDIEVTAARWADRAGDDSLAKLLLNRAGKLTGRMSPYPEDDEAKWSKPRCHEGVMRFGFATTVLAPDFTSRSGTYQ